MNFFWHLFARLSSPPRYWVSKSKLGYSLFYYQLANFLLPLLLTATQGLGPTVRVRKRTNLVASVLPCPEFFLCFFYQPDASFTETSNNASLGILYWMSLYPGFLNPIPQLGPSAVRGVLKFDLSLCGVAHTTPSLISDKRRRSFLNVASSPPPPCRVCVEGVGVFFFFWFFDFG